jgi:mannose-6-phosphate isomerase-like protein (cupin superfamily)
MSGAKKRQILRDEQPATWVTGLTDDMGNTIPVSFRSVPSPRWGEVAAIAIANRFQSNAMALRSGSPWPAYTNSKSAALSWSAVTPREDEAFYVLSGEVLIELEGAADPLHLSAGGFLFASRNQRHGYRNIGTVAARLLVFAMPDTGLDRMFAAFDAETKCQHSTRLRPLPRSMAS